MLLETKSVCEKRDSSIKLATAKELREETDG